MKEHESFYSEDPCSIYQNKSARHSRKGYHKELLKGDVDYYTNMTSQWGYHNGMSPEGGWFSARANIPLGCHICFIIPNKTQFGKRSVKTTIF